MKHLQNIFSGMLVRNEKWWLQAVYEDLTLAIYYDENKKCSRLYVI